MKKAILDLTGCKYLDEIHERIRAEFDFSEWYGKIGVLFGICFGVSVTLIK